MGWKDWRHTWASIRCELAYEARRYLSDVGREALLQLHRDTKQADVRSRCDVTLLSAQGLSRPEIAQCAPLSIRTVLRYIERYEVAGPSGLLPRPMPGRPHRVTPAYEALLVEVMEQEPRSLGWPFSNWTTAKLSAYLVQRTRIKIKARRVEN